MLAEEQIVATVPTSELAETLRRRLMHRGVEVGPRLVVYVFHNTALAAEYHVGVANEHHGKVSEDVLLELMMDVADFQEEQLREEAQHLGMPPEDMVAPSREQPTSTERSTIDG